MIKNLLNPKSYRTVLLAGSLLMALSVGLTSCEKDDTFRRKFQKCGWGDSPTKKRPTKPKDSTNKDTFFDPDDCDNLVKTYIDNIDITNGQSFKASDIVSFKTDVTASNGCAKEVTVSEASRKVNGNTVDIYLNADVHYVGCICTEALVPMTTDYVVKREKSSHSLKYLIHYTDAGTQKEVIKNFNY